MPHTEQTIASGTPSVVPVTLQTLPVYLLGMPNPTIRDSIYSQTADGKKIGIGVGVILGANGGIAIGNGANGGTAPTGSIAIGRLADANGGGNAGGANIALGYGANFGGGTGGLGIAIGNLATINSADGGHIALGNSATVTAGLGFGGAIAIGSLANAAHRAIVLGVGATSTQQGEVVFGDINNGPITLFTIRPGAGVPVRHRNSANGWAIRNLANGADILLVDESAVANDIRLQLWDVTAAALRRVTIGAADSGGAGFRLLRIPN